MSQLFKYLSISFIFMLMGFFVGLAFIPAEVVAYANMFMVFLVLFFLIFALFTKKKSKTSLPRFSMNFVYLFTFIDGILLYPTLMYYLAELGVVIFVGVIVSTLALFLILSVIANKQPEGSYIKLGQVLFPALIVIIIMSIINIFLNIPMFGTLISAAGVIIFSAYILYDVNTFKSVFNSGMIQERDDYSIFVLNIYLDIINLLLDLIDLINDLT